jgi:hypothetical protein
MWINNAHTVCAHAYMHEAAEGPTDRQPEGQRPKPSNSEKGNAEGRQRDRQAGGRGPRGKECKHAGSRQQAAHKASKEST